MHILGKPFHRWRTKSLLGCCAILVVLLYFSDNSYSDIEDSISKNGYRYNAKRDLPNENHDNVDIKQHIYNNKNEDQNGSVGGVKLPNERDTSRQSANNQLPIESHDDRNNDVIEDQDVTNTHEEEIKRTKMYHDIWIEADRIINNREIFQENSHVDKVLGAMRTARIVHIEVLDLGDYESGTSEKWVGVLEGGQKVMIKLLWPG